MSDWYYAHGGQQKGPVPASELQRLAVSGDFDPARDLVWREGLKDWQPVSALPELANLSPATPPQPAPVAGTPAGVPDNPYAAPASGLQNHQPLAGGPLPEVKPANFMLLAVSTSLGFLGLIAGYGIMFVEIFNSGPSGTYDGETEQVMATAGITIILSLIPLLVSLIVGCVYLYRAWVLLQPHTQVSTPGRAVGFLFIPLFNIYWMFVAYWRWAQEWNRIIKTNPDHVAAPRAAEGMFLTYAIIQASSVLLGIFAVIPLVVVYLIGMKNMCDAINYAARR